MFRANPDVFSFVTLRSGQAAKPWSDPADKLGLLEKMQAIKRQADLSIAAYVVLDDHAHFLMRAPAGQPCSTVVNALRADFLAGWHEVSARGKAAPVSRMGWEHRAVVGGAQLRAHLDFIHYDPVRHGLVERAAEYRWSSLPTRVEQGYYREDWAELAPPAAISRVTR
jgi:putative transposase